MAGWQEASRQERRDAFTRSAAEKNVSVALGAVSCVS